jgi:hypothetical protein
VTPAAPQPEKSSPMPNKPAENSTSNK